MNSKVTNHQISGAWSTPEDSNLEQAVCKKDVIPGLPSGAVLNASQKSYAYILAVLAFISLVSIVCLTVALLHSSKEVGKK